MDDTKKISMFQLITLVTVSEIMHQYTYLPILSTVPVNQDSWIALFLFIPYIIILAIPILFLLSKFKNITFYDMMRLILGKVGAKIGIFIFCLFFCFCNIACLVLSIIFIRNYILFTTPTPIIALAILIPIVYIAMKGFRVICSLSVFVIFTIIVCVCLFFVFGANQMNFSLLKPIMGDSTFLQVNIGGFITASRFSDILIIFAVAYRLKDQSKTNKVFLWSVITYVILTLFMVIPTLTTLGVKYAAQAYNPYYVFAKQVEFYTFLQRAEVFVMISWMCGAIVKIAIYHYLMAYYMAKIFGAKSYKPFVIPMTLITFLAITLFGLDKSYLITFIRSDSFFPWIILVFILVIPVILIIIYLIRKKKIEKYKFSISQ